jgi:hypothetical protein
MSTPLSTRFQSQFSEMVRTTNLKLLIYSYAFAPKIGGVDELSDRGRWVELWRA